MKKRRQIKRHSSRPEITFAPPSTSTGTSAIAPRPSASVIPRILIGLAVLLLLLGGITHFVFLRRTWDGQTDKNILLVPPNIDGFTGKIIFAHISPLNHHIDLVSLNPDMTIPLLAGYGQYPLRSVLPFLTLEKKSPQFIRTAYSYGLTKIVDEVDTTQNSTIFRQPKNVQLLLKELLLFHVHSDLSLADRIWLYRFYLDLRPDQITFSEANSLADWQTVSTDIHFPAEARDCVISTINTTNISGVSTSVGKLIEQSGFVVVRVTDTDQVQAQSNLIVESAATDWPCASVVQHLKSVFPTSVEVTMNPQVYQQYRSNLVVLIGQDFADQLNNLVGESKSPPPTARP